MNLILYEADEVGRIIAADDRRAVHLRDVLKAAPGEVYKAGVLNGGIGTLRILEIGDEGVEYELNLYEAAPRPHPLTLLIGAPRPLVAGRLLKDLTSIGAARLAFVTTELCEKSYLESHLWKNRQYRLHLLEGAELAGSTFLPEVDLFPSLPEALSSLGSPRAQFVLDAGAGDRLFDAVLPGEPDARQPAALAVGPERGWTEAELASLEQAGFARVNLGRRILRTEAACLAGAVLLLAKMGCM
jgi:16S rRNA (uracil1498-N3)-methyltransferase